MITEAGRGVSLHARCEAYMWALRTLEGVETWGDFERAKREIEQQLSDARFELQELGKVS